MNKLLIALALTCLTLTGCKLFEGTDPSVLAQLAGAAAGKAVSMANIKPVAHNRIIDVVTVIQDVVPGTNETFAVAWREAATTYVNKLVDEGKIEKDYVAMIVSGVETAGIAIDYLFTKHPEWKENATLTKKVIAQFTAGFLSTCTPVDEKLGGTFKAPVGVDYDRDTYLYLQAIRRF